MVIKFIILFLYITIAILGLVYWLWLILLDISLPYWFDQCEAKIIEKKIRLTADRPNTPEKSTYSYYLLIKYEYMVDNKKYESNSMNVFKHMKAKNIKKFESFLSEDTKEMNIYFNKKKPSISYAFSNTYKLTYVWIPILLHFIGSIIGIFLLITTS